MNNKAHNQKLGNILKVILEVAKGNYSAQVEHSDDNDELDAIAVGINMMIESIKYNHDQIKLLNESLEKSNREKDRFFSIIAHDLKSPFNSVFSFSEILYEKLLENDYTSVLSYAEIVHKSSLRAMELLVNLTEWSLSQSGKIEFNPECFNMEELINEVVLLLSDAARLKSIVIVKETQNNYIVNADKNMISTVLRNLLTNAIKFTHLSGRITISTKPVQQKLIVSIADNGIGMSKERIKQIFQLDESMSTPGTQNEKGTGLGIILCKEFVERNGGELTVESEIDKGSTFSFSIPICN